MELDKYIKNKLNTREIQPSANSWDRLDAMLTQEEKPKKKIVPFYYVAASILIALGFTFWFTNQTSEIIIPENNGIVITNENVPLKIEEIEKVGLQEVLIEDVNEVVLVEQEVKEINKRNKSINSSNNILLEEKTPSKIQNIKPVKTEFRYFSPNELLAEIQGEEIIDTVIKKLYISTKVKVDPNSLLTAVENELKIKHRETFLDNLNRNYNSIKTAVVNRNYE